MLRRDVTYVARTIGDLNSHRTGSVPPERPVTIARSNSGGGNAHGSDNHLDRGGGGGHGLWTNAGYCVAGSGAADSRLDRRRAQQRPRSRQGSDDTLYMGEPAGGVAPDFLAVIDFDRKSPNYGEVVHTVPLPPPGNTGNEPHHCHTSADQKILACGGLLSVLKGQNDIFFFDITDARHPTLLRSTRAPNSSITDDFLALPGGGFLVTNMGSASGGPGGRLAEFDKDLNLVAEHPSVLPADGTFNPHGIDADFSRNLLVTTDFVNPATTLNVVPGAWS